MASVRSWPSIKPLALLSTALLFTAALLLPAPPAVAQLPVANLTTISPAGGKVGSTFDVVIGGASLDEASRLLFSHPGITATQQTQHDDLLNRDTPVDNKFKVVISPDTPPGMYDVRVLGRFGVSNPRTFAVGRLEETTDAGANVVREKAPELALGSVVNGRTDGDVIDHFKIQLKAGQRLIADCFAQRIDSRLCPSLAIYNAQGAELKRVQGALQSDQFLQFEAPQDGAYTLALYDFIFRGGADYFYRLQVHTGPKVLHLFPPSLPPGAKQAVSVFGWNLPGGKPAAGLPDGLQVLQAEVVMPAAAAANAAFGSTSAAMLDSELITPAAGAWREPLRIYVAQAVLVEEKEPNADVATAQRVTAPCEIVGRFYPRNDDDWFVFPAKKGEVYTIEVVSQRLGAACDPYLSVRSVVGKTTKELAQVDDAGARNAGIKADLDFTSDDPQYRLTVKEDGDYVLMIRDQFGATRDDFGNLYRLIIRRETPDFRLVASPQPGFTANAAQAVQSSTALRRGDIALVNLTVERRDGFNGSISVVATGLPPGVTCRPVVLSGSATKASLFLVAAEDAPAWSGAIQIVGEAEIKGQKVQHAARAASLVWATGNRTTAPAVSRVVRTFTLSVSDRETAPVQVTIPEAVVETSKGAKFEVPIKVTRRGEFKVDLVLKAIGAPKEFKPADVTVKAADGAGKLVFSLANAKTPLGEQTFYLQATPKFKYSRNPEAAKPATAEKELLAKRQAETAEQTKQATAAKTKALADVQAAQKQVTAAAAQLPVTAAAVKAAAASVAAGSKKLAAAKKAEMPPEAKAKAVAAAQKEVEKAQAAQKAAQAKADAATKAKTVADAALVKNKAAQTAAEQKEKSLQALTKQVAARIKAADAKIAALNKANAAKDVTFAVVSTPVRLNIHASPIRLTIAATPPLKQGGAGELVVKVERLFGFTGPITLQAAAPKGVKGVTVGKVTVAAGQAEGKLPVKIAADASVGEHKFSVKGTLKFNNVALESSLEAPLAVQAATAAAETPKK